MTRYRHVVEVGAGDSHSTEGLRWSTHADLVTLYEPNPVLYADLARAAAGFSNVHVSDFAVTSEFLPLYCFGYASYLKGRPSFLATSIEQNGETWWEPLAREVSCQKVDRMDFGTIDGLILTTNGSEMDILPRLVSRPRTIWTKHYLHNARQWEEAHKVFDWMARHRYTGKTLASNQHSTFAHACWTLQ